MNTLTIVVLAIIIAFGLVGRAKGFLKMLLSMLSLVVTLLVAVIISPYISEALQKTPIYEAVYTKTYLYVDGAMADAMSSSTDAIMNEMQLPEVIKQYVEKSDLVTQGGAPIAQRIATQITDITFDAIVFFVTFGLAFVGVKVLFTALNIVSRLPIINGANKLAGLIVGLAEGVIVVWVFFIVISMNSNSEFALNMYTQINESAIMSFLYNNNIIMNFLFK